MCLTFIFRYFSPSKVEILFCLIQEFGCFIHANEYFTECINDVSSQNALQVCTMLYCSAAAALNREQNYNMLINFYGNKEIASQ